VTPVGAASSPPRCVWNRVSRRIHQVGELTVRRSLCI
jgi:hypothetical protein